MGKKRSLFRKDIFQESRFWIMCIFIASVLAFSPVFSSGFLNWDDVDYVTNNARIQSLDFAHLKSIFFDQILKTYVPLTIFFFAIEYELFKLNPFYYHLDNFLLHLGVVGLIYFFLKKLKLSTRAAGIAALLFAIHPVHVEAVAWVSSRKDVLYSAFYMLALLSHWTYIEKKRPLYYWLAFACGLFSMLAKPMALSLPLVLLLIDWIYQRKDTGKMFLEKLSYFIYILPLVWVTYSANTSVMKVEHNFAEAGLIFIWTLTFYIKQFFFPFGFTPLYQTPEPVSFAQPAYVVGVLILMICLAAICLYRKNRWIVIVFVFYLCSIFFLLRFDRLYNLSVVADRYMYLPSLGFCLLAGIGVEQLWQRMEHKREWAKLTLGVIACAGFIFLCFKTNLQCRVWKDSFSFWARVIETSPNLSIAYVNRGAIYKDHKKYEESIRDFKESLRLAPSFGAYYNLANIYVDQGNLLAALENYDAAILLDANQATAVNNRGVIYSTLKKYEEAVSDFNKAIELDPKFFDPYYNQASCYFYLNQTDLAIESYGKAIILRPDFQQAYINRAVIYIKQGRLNVALKEYDALILRNPRLASAYFDRSRIYADLKQFDKAIDDARQAKSLGQADIDQYINQLTQLRTP